MSEKEQQQPSGADQPVSSSPPPEPESPIPDESEWDDDPRERFDVGNLHTPIMREKLDPKDGYEPVPIWLVSLFGIVIFWGGWYLATYSGGFRGDIYDSDPAARYRVVAPGVPEPAEAIDPMVLGERVYRAAGCLACHQADGSGLPNVYPPLVDTHWVLDEPARLKRIVLHGMEGPVTVRGEVYDSPMPGFARRSDEELAAVLTYIRNSWGNSASEITPESVAATREATADRTAAWTESELMAITEDDLPEEEGAAGEAIEADDGEEADPDEGDEQENGDADDLDDVEENAQEEAGEGV